MKMSENISLISSALVPVEDIESEFTLYSIEQISYVNFWRGKNRYFLLNQYFMFKQSGFCILNSDYLDNLNNVVRTPISIVSFFKSLIPKYIPQRYMPKHKVERFFMVYYKSEDSLDRELYHHLCETERRKDSYVKKLESDGCRFINVKPIEVNIFTFKKSIISLLEQLPYKEIQKDIRGFYCRDELVEILKEYTKKSGIPFDVYINSWAKKLIKDAESGKIIVD
jgi:hypothetical protein